MIKNDAASLISANGCKHPGITEVLNNLHYYLDGYSEPAEWPLPKEILTNRYIFNEKEKYYQDTIVDFTRKHYVDAPSYFTPAIVYPPDSNAFYSEIVVHHASQPSPGVVSMTCHTFNLSLLRNGKYINENDHNKYNLPPEIEADYRKNTRNYYFIEVVYNRYNNGVLERKKENFWLDNGTLPSAEFRQFFSEHIKGPVKKIELDYDVKE